MHGQQISSVVVTHLNILFIIATGLLGNGYWFHSFSQPPYQCDNDVVRELSFKAYFPVKSSIYDSWLAVAINTARSALVNNNATTD